MHICMCIYIYIYIIHKIIGSVGIEYVSVKNFECKFLKTKVVENQNYCMFLCVCEVCAFLKIMVREKFKSKLSKKKKNFFLFTYYKPA